MSLEQILPDLSALCAGHTVGPAREWKVLYARRARSVLVPISDAEQAQAALDFFIRSRLLRFWGRLRLFLDRMPWGSLLPSVKLDHFPFDVVFGSTFAPESPLSVYCGSPGPLQKLTAFSPGGAREVGRIAKIALRASADQSVVREAYWLRELGASKATARFLPRLLGEGTLACGRRFVAMSVLPGSAARCAFDDSHRTFLAALADHARIEAGWSRSEAFVRLERRSRSLMALPDIPYRNLVSTILAEIERLIGERKIPACLVHGDFAPWNMTATPAQLFVFDWEYAETSGNPLQDFLHFHLIGRASRRRAIRKWFMRRLLAQTVLYAKLVFGTHSTVASSAGPLILHYLLDTITFYAEAEGHPNTQHPVTRAYLRLLEGRAQWMS